MLFRTDDAASAASVVTARWPIGFGDKAKADEQLLQALTLNPKCFNTNFFYREYLVETRQPDWGFALA